MSGRSATTPQYQEGLYPTSTGRASQSGSLQRRLSVAARRNEDESRRLLEMDTSESIAYLEKVEEQLRKGKLTPETDDLYRQELLARFPESSKPPLNDLTGEVRKCSPHAVGGGAYGDIYIGEWDGEKVALKVFRRYRMRQDVFDQRLMEELNISHRMDHPRVLKMYGFASIDEQIALVSPWMDRGDALAYVQSKPRCDRVKLLEDVASGMKYLHYRANIVHGDLRAVNVLVDDKGRAVIADFGLSRRLRQVLETNGIVTKDSRETHARWVAPELLVGDADKVYMSPYTDVWSFGMLGLEFTTGKMPFTEHPNDNKFIGLMISGLHLQPQRPSPTASVGLTDELWALMTQCWSYQPKQRPLMDKIFIILKGMTEAASRTDRRRATTSDSSAGAPLADLNRSLYPLPDWMLTRSKTATSPVPIPGRRKPPGQTMLFSTSTSTAPGGPSSSWSPPIAVGSAQTLPPLFDDPEILAAARYLRQEDELDDVGVLVDDLEASGTTVRPARHTQSPVDTQTSLRVDVQSLSSGSGSGVSGFTAESSSKVTTMSPWTDSPSSERTADSLKAVVRRTKEAYAVHAASVKSLVDRLVTSIDHSGEAEFTKTFWICYRGFCTDDTLFDLLKSYFSEDDEDRQLWSLRTMSAWLRACFVDHNFGLSEPLRMFLLRVQDAGGFDGLRRELLELLEVCVATPNPNFASGQQKAAAQIEAVALAKALTFLEGFYYSRLTARDCFIYLVESRVEDSLRKVLTVNVRIYLWVQWAILAEGPWMASERPWKRRVDRFLFFVKVAESCLACHNLSSALAIIEALASDDIAGVPMIREYRNCHDYRKPLAKLDRLTDPADTFRNYIDALPTAPRPSSSSKWLPHLGRKPAHTRCLPRISTHLRHLAGCDILREPSFIVDPGGELVHFSKWARLAARVRDALRFAAPEVKEDRGALAYLVRELDGVADDADTRTRIAAVGAMAQGAEAQLDTAFERRRYNGTGL